MPWGPARFPVLPPPLGRSEKLARPAVVAPCGNDLHAHVRQCLIGRKPKLSALVLRGPSVIALKHRSHRAPVALLRQLSEAVRPLRKLPVASSRPSLRVPARSIAAMRVPSAFSECMWIFASPDAETSPTMNMVTPGSRPDHWPAILPRLIVACARTQRAGSAGE